MNQRMIGAIVLIVGILVAGFTSVAKAREDRAIGLLIEERSSCYLDDGTCLHEDRDYAPFTVGWVIAAALAILGVYLLLFDRTQQTLAQQHLAVVEALKEAKRQERSKDEFTAFLAGFSEEEQRVLKAVKEQEGIKQSTLRYRADMSKSSLSLLLASLEKRGLVSRKAAGKTNQVYLRKKF